MPRGAGQKRTRCECGRPITRNVRPHGVRSGCERCNAIEGRTGYLREKAGSAKPDTTVYGMRAAVSRACRKFWAKRGLPEPTGSFHSPRWLD